MCVIIMLNKYNVKSIPIAESIPMIVLYDLIISGWIPVRTKVDNQIPPLTSAPKSCRIKKNNIY